MYIPRKNYNLLRDMMKITNLTREIDEKTLQGNHIMGGRETCKRHVQCFFAMKIAGIFANAMDNGVWVPEIKNKPAKYPWMTILRQILSPSLTLLKWKKHITDINYVAETEETHSDSFESREAHLLYTTQEVKSCRYISTEIHISRGNEVKR